MGPALAVTNFDGLVLKKLPHLEVVADDLLIKVSFWIGLVKVSKK